MPPYLGLPTGLHEYGDRCNVCFLYNHRCAVQDSRNSHVNVRTQVCSVHAGTEEPVTAGVAPRPSVSPYLGLPIFHDKCSMCSCIRASRGLFSGSREDTHVVLLPERWYTEIEVDCDALLSRRKRAATCGQTQSVANHASATIDLRALVLHLPVSHSSQLVQVLQPLQERRCDRRYVTPHIDRIQLTSQFFTFGL